MTDIDFAGKVAASLGGCDILVACAGGNASFVTGTNHVVDGGRLCMYQPYVPTKEHK